MSRCSPPVTATAVPAAPAGRTDSTDWAEVAHCGGVVFAYRDRDSVQDRGERALGGVTVTKGHDVVTPDSKGRYELPAYDDMTVPIILPRSRHVPDDEDNVAKFYYQHLPEAPRS